MSCERCLDIHKAQRDGKTGRGCGCHCHDKGFTTTGTTATTGTGFQYTTNIGSNDIDSITYTSADSSGTCDCNEAD